MGCPPDPPFTEGPSPAMVARIMDQQQNGAAHLAPPVAKGARMITRLPDHWFIACTSDELGRTPIARTVLGVPLALFRDTGGRPAALLDRCPHRNVPLSIGRVAGGLIECRYHGWKFDGGGACREIPGLCGDASGKARRAPAYPTVEQQGYVWVYSTPDVEPVRQPYRFPHLDDAGYTVVRRSLEYESTLHSALENALDVPHTRFLHEGLFRQNDAAKSTEIEVVVRRSAEGVEAEYIGEPRPPGIAARILSPSGGVVTHFDRFLLPSIAQVEYRIGTENHILISTAMTPIEDTRTAIHAVVALKMRLPGKLIRPVLEPIAMRIFQQDAEILAEQTKTVKRFGGEQYASTEIDILGNHIWRLLKQTERGDAPVAPSEERVRLLV